MKTKILIFGSAVLAVLFLCRIEARAVVLDEEVSARQSNIGIKGEIIIKFKSQEALEANVNQLNAEGKPQLAAGIKPQISSAIMSGIKTKADFKLKGNEIISYIRDMPANVKALVKEDSELEPVFKSLHRKMAVQGKTESELDKDNIEKLSKVRILPKGERKSFNLSNVYILKNINTRNRPIEDICQEVAEDPNVEYTEPNYIARVQIFPDTLPNDTYVNPSGDGVTWSTGAWNQVYENMWGLKKIRADRAWPIFQGEGVIVAVIDTGVDYNHPDLSSNIWQNIDEIPGNGIDDDNNGYIDDVKGWDFAYNDNNPMDEYGHGTHVSGTIAAVGNNQIGVIGIAPKAKIMVVKGLNDSGSGSSFTLADAVIYAADNGADILNNSWGGEFVSQVLIDVFHYAYSKGCIAVAAAGNNNSNVQNFSPANIDTVIAVSASTQNDEKCSFSNYGLKIDVAAPGGGYINELGGGDSDKYNIISTMPDNSELARSKQNCKISTGYWRLAGTSMACPHVAGIAALLISKNNFFGNDIVRRAIQLSADDIGQTGKDNYFGYGRINAFKTLNSTADIWFDLPLMNSYLHGETQVSGSAIITNFRKYELWYAAKSEPDNATLIISSTVPVQNDVLDTWHTIRCEDGDYVLTLKVVDNDNMEWKEYIDVTVDNVNQPPSFISPSHKTAVIGRLFEFEVKAADPDDPKTPAGQLQYTLPEFLPPGAQFDSEKHILSWQPSEENKGTYHVLLTARDSKHAISQELVLSTIYIEITQITTDPAWQGICAIYGDKIAWEDTRHGSNDIYIYDLLTGQEIRITYDPNAQSNVSIYENKIIWSDYRNGNADIYMHDLVTHEEIPLVTGQSNKLRPAFYGDRIVWDDDKSGSSHIYMYDISSAREYQITDESFSQLFPDIYEDKIVWTQIYPDGERDICLYDITTGEKRQITNDSYSQNSPNIYGNKIVWEDYRNGGQSDIYLHDLTTGQEFQITNDRKSQSYPCIYENRIIWRDARNRYFNIYMYDLATNEEIQVTNDAVHKYFPAVYQDKIVWNATMGGNTDVYMARVIFTPQLTSVSPTTLPPSSFITLTGKNFGYTQMESIVRFENGTICPIESWSNAEIVCRVPQNAQSGLLKVETLAGRSNGIEVTVNDTVISGRISDNRGFPITGAKVIAAKYSNDNFTGTMSKQAEVTTDPTGHYFINGPLPQGAYTVQAYYGNCMPEYHSQFVTPSQNYIFNFTLREYPVILGVVRNNLDQARLQGVIVTLKDAATGLMVPGYQRITDSEGTFRIYPEDNIPNGDYYAICAKTGFTQPSYIPKMTVQQGKYNLVTVYVNEVINNPASIFGVVKSTSGNPIYRAQIDLVHKVRGLNYRAFTDASGYYKFGGLLSDLPGQEYGITVSMYDYITVSGSITLHPNENRHASYNLTASCGVSGLVTDGSGNAIYGTKVELFKEGGTLFKTYNITYPGKSYGFKYDMLAGAYKLRVTAFGYQSQEQTITFTTQGEQKTVNFSIVK